MQSLFRAVGCSLVLVSAAGCGGKQHAATKPAGVQLPAWVEKGSGAFPGDKSRVFRGVGSVSGIKDIALARVAADNRARAEIGKIFEVYSASLMKDYMASTTAGDMKASSEEQHVEQAIKTFSATTLRGVQIVNRWMGPDGTWYSLAELDLTAVTAALDKAKELDAKVRDYVRKNAERAMADLDKEETKRAGGAPAAPAQAAEAPAAPTPPAAPPTCKTGQVLQCGQCLDVAASLDKIRWEMPCVAGHGVVCRSAVVRPVKSLSIGGVRGAQYDVVLRFRGVVEQNSYAGGAADAYWYTGGKSADGHYNIYEMDVSAPPQVFFLNAGQAGITRTFALDYVRTVRVEGGAQITLTADDQDRELIENRDEAGKPIVVADVSPAPQAFDGQFIQMDVVSVTLATDAVCSGEGNRR